MAGVLERIPEAAQAGLIDRLLASPHPRLALPTIASNAHMTLDDLRALLAHHGYPDRQRLAAARDRLLQNAGAAEPEYADLGALTIDELASAAPVDELSTTAVGRLAQVPVVDLHPDPDNPRDKILDTDVEELADSIAEIGLLQPVVARQTDRGLVVVAGHRRLTAIKLLGWTHAPTIIRSDMRPDDVLAAMLIENGQRRDLDPIEEARGLNKLKAQAQCTDMDLAKRVGRGQPFVSARLALLLLSPEDQDRVRAGDLGITQATALGRLNGGKVRKRSKGSIRESHFDVSHELARHANARCKRLGHKSRLAGGQACGECWESVIRADERNGAQKRLAETGTCPTCG
ncbi:ParB/RepB/Spo0J family partition protein [Nocardioides sp. WV_118_6]